MKIEDILLEYRVPSNQRKRPRKTLWFDNRQLWEHDIIHRYPQAKLLSAEDDTKQLAVDSNNKFVYGVWYRDKRRGVTFHAPRPIGSVTNDQKILKKSMG